MSNMKVILLKDVKGVGKRFDEKQVSDGYAANFLMPEMLAVVADKAGLAKVAQIKEASSATKAKEDARLRDKEAKRLEKHLALERFKAGQK